MKNVILFIMGFISIQAYSPNKVLGQGCQTPTAGFQYETSGFTATFWDSSAVTGQTTYSWDFGDLNGTSTNPYPTYTFSSSGSFWVCLTIVDSCGTDVYCDSVTIAPCTSPTANFTYSVAGQNAVDFYANVSTTGMTTYSWDFGDGMGTSAVQYPSYTYNALGTYTVCLTITDDCGTDVYCENITITQCTPPVPGFNYTLNQNLVSFYPFQDSSSTILASTYTWEIYADTSNLTNPIVNNSQNPTYSLGGGTYWVCLTITNACGSGTYCNFVTMPGCTAPVSGFTYSSFATGPVYFNEIVSSTGVTSYNWDFGDGIGTSTSQDPTYLFSTLGTYQVCLTVSDVCGTDVYCEDIEICPKPTAYFDYTTNQLTVTFSDSSNTSTTATYFWEISTDSNMTNSITSTLQNPTILMDSAGTYYVCLIVTDSCGSDWYCDSIVVNKMGTVGFEDRSMNGDEKLASIYPNPAKSKLAIRFNELQENAEIQIVDVIGKLVMKYDDEQINVADLDVSKLKNGVYFIHIKSSDMTMTKKIIINH